MHWHLSKGVRWTRKQDNKNKQGMTRTARALIISAAMTGLVAGTMTTGCKSEDNGAKASDSSLNKHDCKGMNACKGQGGCKTGDMGCKGKNDCKGKGGCKVA
jgi:hypothetical protein